MAEKYELWRVGEVREEDARLASFDKAADALSALDERRKAQPDESFEVRRGGVRIDLGTTPPPKRSTRPSFAAIETDPGDLSAGNGNEEDTG